MKKLAVVSSIVLFISVGAFILSPVTAQTQTEAEKVLQKLNEGDSSQPSDVNPFRDYVLKETKEHVQKLFEKRDGTKLEFGKVKENIIVNDFLFAIYNIKLNGEKGYILFCYLRDKKFEDIWRILPEFLVFKRAEEINGIEICLFGNNSEERRKFIENISQKYIQDLKQTPAQVPKQVKSSVQ